MSIRHQPKPHLLIDGTPLSDKAKGVGRYTYHICLELDQRLSAEWGMTIVSFDRALPVFPPGFRGNFLRIPYKSDLELGLLYFPRLIRQEKPTAFIRPKESIGLNYGVPTVTVCHDLNEIIWQYQPARSLLRRLLDKGFQALRVHALRHSDLVICNSQFVQNEVVKQYRIPSQKTQIGYCGVDERFYLLAPTLPIEQIQARYGGQGFLLSFATGDYRENFTCLPAVLQELRAQNYPGALVIAGIKAESPYAHDLVADFTQRNLIQNQDYFLEPFLGEDRFADLAGLYTAADFYLELSWHEGFGMQLAEAMACGTTCICSGQGALQEVGDRWTIGIDPNNSKSTAIRITKAWLDNSHRRNNCEQIEFTKRYSWKRVGALIEQHLSKNCRYVNSRFYR